MPLVVKLVTTWVQPRSRKISRLRAVRAGRKRPMEVRRLRRDRRRREWSNRARWSDDSTRACDHGRPCIARARCLRCAALTRLARAAGDSDAPFTAPVSTRYTGREAGSNAARIAQRAGVSARRCAASIGHAANIGHAAVRRPASRGRALSSASTRSDATVCRPTVACSGCCPRCPGLDCLGQADAQSSALFAAGYCLLRSRRAPVRVRGGAEAS